MLLQIQALFPERELFADNTPNIRKGHMSCSCITPRAGSKMFAKSARILSSSSGYRTVLCLPRYAAAKTNISLSVWRADQ